MSDLDALYQEIILDHNRRPRNFGVLEGADRTVAGRNPLCGDELSLQLRMDGDTIAEARFTARGCAISRASASMLTSAVTGKSREEAERLTERVHQLLTGTLEPPMSDVERKALGPLAALGGVSKFPIRVKCASLAWHALREGLQRGVGSGASGVGMPMVSTEGPGAADQSS
ncbi:MAG TPA: SUF system NifU family Fe-S cluster assembly protein [Gemmatimonadaceae bacterium]|nr:SUF system NifU family Fe-S cluster assembly protein [Gemmatimonadaceae bacterium]